MKTTTARRTGRLVWRDLMTTDLESSKRFYTALLGWTAADEDRGDFGTWTVLRSGATPVARFVPFDASHGFPSHWVSYVSVEDVAAACERAPELAGACCYPACDDGELGTFAMLEDPGKGFTKPLRSAAGDPSFDTAEGRFIWDALLSPEPGATARFYEGLYGWSLYASDPANAIFELEGEGVASLGPALDGVPGNVWLPCARVASVEAAAVKARELGGKILRAPGAVPHVGKLAIVGDPAGARVGLLEPAPSRPRPKRAKATPVAKTSARPAAKPRAVRKPEPAPAAPSRAYTPAELFARSPTERYDAAAGKDLRGVAQYDVTGENGGHWHIVFEPGKCEVREGVHPSPDVSFSLSAADYVDLALGKLTGVAAVTSGRMKMDGDRGLAFKVAKALKPLKIE